AQAERARIGHGDTGRIGGDDLKALCRDAPHEAVALQGAQAFAHGRAVYAKRFRPDRLAAKKLADPLASGAGLGFETVGGLFVTVGFIGFRKHLNSAFGRHLCPIPVHWQDHLRNNTPIGLTYCPIMGFSGANKLDTPAEDLWRSKLLARQPWSPGRPPGWAP